MHQFLITYLCFWLWAVFVRLLVSEALVMVMWLDLEL